MSAFVLLLVLWRSSVAIDMPNEATCRAVVTQALNQGQSEVRQALCLDRRLVQ